jgi:5-methylcytosine-specific restriction endonuclease McrA
MSVPDAHPRTCRKCKAVRPVADFIIQRRIGPAVWPTCVGCRRPVPIAQKRACQVYGGKLRAEKLGLVASLTLAEWEEVLARSGGRCFYCRECVGVDALTLDHRVPFRKGGGHSAENVVASCWPCNNSKSSVDYLGEEGCQMKVQFNVRLDERTIQRINALRDDLGISQADVIRLAVRAMAARDNRKYRKKNPDKPGQNP